VVREGRFDIVHFHSPALAALARPALRGVRPRPAVVTTEHNRWPSYHPVTRAANRVTSGLDDATLAVSEDVKASMGSAGVDVEVVVHGVDVEALRSQRGARAEVRAELGIGDDELLALTIANLRVDKAYDDLLAAARIVSDAGAPVRFAAAGQGPLEEQLRAGVLARGLDGTFTFLGYVPDAARLLAGADVFVLASLHEGLPVAVMEALAMGVPVVATRVGGLPELVDDGVSGRLVPPRAPQALADAILELSDDETRRRLAAGALARGDSVDGRAAFARIEEVYRGLAARRR
jgi:glycosyltransferase involved in cell wall biosynthesis